MLRLQWESLVRTYPDRGIPLHGATCYQYCLCLISMKHPQFQQFPPLKKHLFLTVKCAAFLLAALLAPLKASAAVILVIDISNPALVTFTATNANAQNNDDESWLQEGISLIGFFSSSVADSSLYFFETPSNLWSPGGNFAYSTLASINFADPFSSTYLDLSIFGSGFSTQDFSTNAPALTGYAEAGLSAWVAQLPTPGTTGDIYSSDGIDFSGPVIGQYVVIPEPSSAALIACGGLLAWMQVRRRK
jgi:hypothetical protein